MNAYFKIIYIYFTFIIIYPIIIIKEHPNQNLKKYIFSYAFIESIKVNLIIII